MARGFADRVRSQIPAILSSPPPPALEQPSGHGLAKLMPQAVRRAAVARRRRRAAGRQAPRFERRGRAEPRRRAVQPRPSGANNNMKPLCTPQRRLRRQCQWLDSLVACSCDTGGGRLANMQSARGRPLGMHSLQARTCRAVVPCASDAGSSRRPGYTVRPAAPRAARWSNVTGRGAATASSSGHRHAVTRA